jgi:hypothetical protein
MIDLKRIQEDYRLGRRGPATYREIESHLSSYTDTLKGLYAQVVNVVPDDSDKRREWAGMMGHVADRIRLTNIYLTLKGILGTEGAQIASIPDVPDEDTVIVTVRIPKSMIHNYDCPSNSLAVSGVATVPNIPRVFEPCKHCRNEVL